MKDSVIPLSLLDLAILPEGSTPGDAVLNTVRLAQAAEKAGYHRYWLSEHHNLADIASAATAVILSHVGANTRSIRIGSGGVMLPNHAPLIIAEQFATLDILYPNRVDLGLGRAPGTDQETVQALRRDARSLGQDFPEMLEELQHFFAPARAGQRVKAIPGAGMNIPIWLLGSSTFSAQLAARKGLPFVFASHFAPDSMMSALRLYRSNFKPSAQLSQPYVMICVNAVAAETVKEADWLATTELQKFINMGRGINAPVAKPVEDMDALWTPDEAQQVLHSLRESLWGTPQMVCRGLKELVERTGADEVMVNSWIHDPVARIRSHEIIAQCWYAS
ncbi:luciferase [Serratia sp. Leaf50]|nr:luciferase [Serratia sp. Leaf50]